MYEYILLLIIGILFGYFINNGLRIMALIDKVVYFKMLLKGIESEKVILKKDGIVLNDFELLKLFELEDFVVNCGEE